jgi:hypothetical protein
MLRMGIFVTIVGTMQKDGFLSQFYTLATTDPLFAAEGMDLDRAETTLARIEQEISKHEGVLSADSFVRRLFLTHYPIAQYAIPLPFLRAFIRSERMRRAFLSAPSLSTARDLLDSWSATQKILYASVRRYITLHRILCRLEPKADTFVLQDMFGNSSTLGHIDGTLHLLERNALVLKHSIESRERILNGMHGGEEEPPSPVGTNVVYEEGGRLLVEHAHLHALHITHGFPYRRADILEEHGPLFYILPHFDGTPTPHRFFLYIIKDRETGVESLEVAAADMFHFLAIDGPQARFGQIGRTPFETLITHGLHYWYQSATHLYTMRDQQYWVEMATAVDLVRRPELDRHLVLSQRSSLLDLIWGACASDLDGFTGHQVERIQHKALTSFSFLYGLLIRSHPSIYYMSFNRSVWRLKEQPNFLGSGQVPQSTVLYRPLEEVRSHLSVGELALVMRGGRIREEARKSKGKSILQRITEEDHIR